VREKYIIALNEIITWIFCKHGTLSVSCFFVPIFPILTGGTGMELIANIIVNNSQ